MARKAKTAIPASGDAGARTGPGPVQVAEQLRGLIVDGSFRAGTRITERAVAERFECSAAATREAFHLLEKQGAIIVSARRGARVIGPDLAPPDELFVVWDRLRWLLGEELRRGGQTVEAIAGGDEPQAARARRLALIETRLEKLGARANNPRLAQAMARVALHVAIVAPDRLGELEESLRR